MDALTRAGYLAHAESMAFERRVERALADLASGYGHAPRAYVSMSFGKDSAVCLDLAARVLGAVPDARFLRWPETELLDDFAAVDAQWRARGIAVQVLDLSRAGLDDRVGDRWERLGAISEADGVIMGLRSQESRVRAINLRSLGRVHRLVSGMWRICPIAEWRTEDVAAYVVSRDLPTLATYQGRGFDERTSSRVPRQGVRADLMRRLWQDAPQRAMALCEMYPELRGVA